MGCSSFNGVAVFLSGLALVHALQQQTHLLWIGTQLHGLGDRHACLEQLQAEHRKVRRQMLKGLDALDKVEQDMITKEYVTVGDVLSSYNSDLEVLLSHMAIVGENPTMLLAISLCESRLEKHCGLLLDRLGHDASPGKAFARPSKALRLLLRDIQDALEDMLVRALTRWCCLGGVPS